MAIPIRVPDVGTNVDEVKLVSWLKSEGEELETGEVIAELETDKAVVELEATTDGFLLDIEVAEGEMAVKGDILAYIGEENEKVERESALSATDKSDNSTVSALSVSGAGREHSGGDAIKASPLVLNMARKRSIDLKQVPGTGPGGRIMRADLINYEASPKQTVVRKPEPAVREPDAATDKKTGSVELTSNQLRVAATVSRSHREIPVVHFKTRVDMTAVIAFRDGSFSSLSGKLSFDSLFLFAVSRVLREFPLVHSSFRENQAITGAEIDIGFALGVENDLYIPVVRNTAVKPVEQIDEEIRSLAEKGKNGRLTVEELSGGSFLISNLGMYDIDEFDAIIPPEYGGALAIGSVRNEAVVIQGGIHVRPITRMTLSVDHRLVNGRVAAEFLSALKRYLENGKFD